MSSGPPTASAAEGLAQRDLEVCKRRDPKGLYRKALSAEVAEFTGISSPYEPPVNPEMVVRTDVASAEVIATAILRRLGKEGIVPKEAGNGETEPRA